MKATQIFDAAMAARPVAGELENNILELLASAPEMRGKLPPNAQLPPHGASSLPAAVKASRLRNELIRPSQDWLLLLQELGKPNLQYRLSSQVELSRKRQTVALEGHLHRLLFELRRQWRSFIEPLKGRRLYTHLLHAYQVQACPPQIVDAAQRYAAITFVVHYHKNSIPATAGELIDISRVKMHSLEFVTGGGRIPIPVMRESTLSVSAGGQFELHPECGWNLLLPFGRVQPGRNDLENPLPIMLVQTIDNAIDMHDAIELAAISQVRVDSEIVFPRVYVELGQDTSVDLPVSLDDCEMQELHYAIQLLSQHNFNRDATASTLKKHFPARPLAGDWLSQLHLPDAIVGKLQQSQPDRWVGIIRDSMSRSELVPLVRAVVLGDAIAVDDDLYVPLDLTELSVGGRKVKVLFRSEHYGRKLWHGDRFEDDAGASSIQVVWR